MSSTYGENLKLSIFGQSHGNAIGMVLDGIPAGLPVDCEALQSFLNRRAPGGADWATPRKESDTVEILSGVADGFTCGAPISAIIRNSNHRSGDYSNLRYIPRPGHADFTAQVKYGGFQDVAGGGHFSGRLTAPLCIAGGLCRQWLAQSGIQIGAHIARIGQVQDAEWNSMSPDLDSIGEIFPVLDGAQGEKMRCAIADAKECGDSLGGIIECAAVGLPAGLGEPMFGGVENRIAQIVYGIPAVKGIEFGIGFACAEIPGSLCNDPFSVSDGKVVTNGNHCGGILGGITNGMPLLFRVAVKPTPSIAKCQQSIDLRTAQAVPLQITGRHDPCIVPRAVPVVEAATAIALFDLILGNTQTDQKRK